MEIEEVRKDTIQNLRSIIDELRGIQSVEKISYNFNTQDIYTDNFVDNFLDKIEKRINHKESLLSGKNHCHGI